jgi:hypothetical protein
MRKIIIILTILSLVLLTACTPAIIKQQNFNCSANGYISYHEVNQLINISNRLITINNICMQSSMQSSNLTPIPYIAYLPEN